MDEPRHEPGDGDPDLTSLHVRRAIGGDDESLGWLVERLSPLLQAQARYRLGPKLAFRCDPEDVVHDAWLTTLPRIAELPPRDGRFTPVLLKFLSTTILNRVRNLLRDYARHGTESLPPFDMSSDRSGAVTQAMRHERVDAVRAALDSLETGDREVILLRGVEQQPAKLVGVLLEISEEAVSKRYRRALEKLRARLPGSVFDELSPDA
ncbi:MAG: sigma-70 family RNA polymerase sigma factor [Planctomycetes bacterium]|nr:sigma-70 family RNA polymerase sigma factor [Planctomycetota bacterium]